MATVSSAAKDEALGYASDRLVEKSDELLSANARDVARAEAAGAPPAVVDRLKLTETRVAQMALGLRTVMGLPDPVGEVVDGCVRPNGLRVERVRVPLGVVGIIYENRPNVTAMPRRCASSPAMRPFCGGRRRPSESNRVIAWSLREAIEKAGLPEDAVVPGRGHQSHKTAVAFMRLRGVIDCLIPRGGPALLAVDPRARHRALRARRGRQLPCLCGRGRRPRHGRSHRRQRQDPAAERLQRRRDALRPPGGRRPSSCRRLRRGAGRGGAGRETPAPGRCCLGAAIGDRGGLRHGVPRARSWRSRWWTTSTRAIDHIARYGSGHSEAIVTSDLAAATRFTTRGRRRRGARQRLDPVRRRRRSSAWGRRSASPPRSCTPAGPMGLRELTCVKYIV